MSGAETTIVAYKGFGTDMKCRGMQYAVDEIAEHVGEVEACESGLHSCESPLDVFEYYPPGTSIYAKVEASGKIARHGGDTKVASARLRVVAKLSLPDYIAQAFEWVKSHCTSEGSQHATGDQSASSATGDRSASSATGYQSASLNTGWYSSSEIKLGADGEPLQAVAIATGYQSKARAPAGSAIVLVERDDKGNILHIRASKVGENGILPDKFFTLKDGDFVEVTEES